MKSAYELAMERLQKTSPTIALTEEQKAQLAEIESQFRAKVAERELFLKGEIASARAKGEFGEAETLEKQLASDLQRLRADCETKKERDLRARS